MKHFSLLLVCLLFLTSNIFAQKLQTTDSCQVRDSEFWRTSKKISITQTNQVFTITDTYGDWYYVEVVGNSDHIGKKGFVWVERLDRQNQTIIPVGVCLRSSAEVIRVESEPPYKKNLVAMLRGGTQVKIINVVPTWYKIEGDGITGWVSAKFVKILK